jgi:tetratricopeptide (TPR) repeat protein
MLVAGLVLAAGAPQLWAWYHLRAARDALDRYHPEEARPHLVECLKIWPNQIHVHVLASRAARQCGDFDAADRELRAGQQAEGGSSDEIAFEWSLLRAASGDLLEVEEYLQWRLEQDPRLSPLVWEALVEGYIRIYRILDALACLDHWLRLEPDNLRALELRGLAYQNGKSAYKGAQDLRRVIEKDPSREATRWRLAMCLLNIGAYDEAFAHLEFIARTKANDPDVQVHLARCHNMLGRPAKARQILDDVIRDHPEHSTALRTRAQFALADRQPAAAEAWLREATRLAPNDYQAHHMLSQALHQQGKTEAAQAEAKVAQEMRQRAERLGELRSRKLSEQPLDPALHYEMGVLLARGGHLEIAESWFLSALNLAPDYQPAHAALADYYEKRGDPRAAEHRRLAN